MFVDIIFILLIRGVFVLDLVFGERGGLGEDGRFGEYWMVVFFVDESSLWLL